jgi:hypothetical protein
VREQRGRRYGQLGVKGRRREHRHGSHFKRHGPPRTPQVKHSFSCVRIAVFFATLLVVAHDIDALARSHDGQLVNVKSDKIAQAMVGARGEWAR